MNVWSPKSRFGWKLFALLMALLTAIGDIPKLFHVLPFTEVLRVVSYCLAVVGLAGYAFDRSILPMRIWRIFAPIFCAMSVYEFAKSIGPITQIMLTAQGSMFKIAGLLLAIIPIFALAWFTCLGLLRHARILGINRVPLGEKPPVDQQYQLAL